MREANGNHVSFFFKATFSFWWEISKYILSSVGLSWNEVCVGIGSEVWPLSQLEAQIGKKLSKRNP